MIQHIAIRGFKSLREIDLELGPMNLFVGTNASGKSNFFDALRVLQGIGYGFTIEEILNGKPKGPSSEVWEPIRGGSTKASFVGRDDSKPAESLGFDVHMTLAHSRSFEYSIELSAEDGCVVHESVRLDGADVYYGSADGDTRTGPAIRVEYATGRPGRRPVLPFAKSRPVLTQIARSEQISETDRAALIEAARALSNTQRVDPAPSVLREYSKAQSVGRFGERGENFAALVKSIIADPKSKASYVAWLRQLTPTEVDDVEIMTGALQEPLFALREGTRLDPAPILSDGTLRFAALAAAFFQPDMPGILTLEEIENGIHPSRLRLLVEMIRRMTNYRKIQVMATTHSPIVLAWLDEAEHRTTFFCSRDATTGASTIRPLSEIPDFERIIAKQPIGELFAEGWLEGAL